LTQNGNLEIPSGKEWTFNNQFEVNGNLTNIGTATFKDDINVSGDTTNSGTATFEDDIDVNGNLTNNGTATFDDVNVAGNVTDTGTWAQTTGVLTFDGSGTDPQIFTPKAGTSYANITLNKSAGSFETDASNALTAGTFTITACPSTTFKGVSTFNSFVNDTSTTETISFENNANINSAATFNRPVTISGAATIQTTTGGQTYTKAVTINADATFKALSGQTINFENIVSGDGSGNLTINTADSVFAGAVSGVKDFTTAGTVTFNNTVSVASLDTQVAKINCTSITTTGNQTYNDAVSLIKDGDILLRAKNGSDLQTVNIKASIDYNGAQDSDNPNLIVDANANIECAAITTKGNQTYNGTVTLNQATVLTARTTDATPVNKIITFKGDVSSSAALTLQADTDINTDSIETTGAQVYNGVITVSKDTILTANGINYSSNISGTGKTLTIDTPAFTSTIASGTANIQLGTLKIKQNTSLDSTNGTTIALDVSTIDKDSTAALTFGSTAAAITLKDEISVVPNVTNAGNLSCSGKATFGGNVTNNGTLTGDATNGKLLTFTGNYSGTGTLTASSGTTTFSANATLANTTFNNSSGTVELTGANAVLDGGTEKAFNNLVIENSVTIKGSNSFVNLTAQNLGGKKIEFEAGTEQSVSGVLTLTGSGTNNELQLRSTTNNSTWTIKCTADSASSHNIQFVDVKDSTNSSEYSSTTYKLFAISSKDSSKNINWNFPGYEYIWTGAGTVDTTDWNDAGNWNHGSVPGIGATVIIENASSYPVLKTALNLNETFKGTNYEGTITVKENSIFTLADKSLSVGTITNNGLVRLVGKTTQIHGSMSNGTSEN
ncbi:MAG: hypothetical protein IKN54_03140, partial [Lachnospiraceae bacterium]|nr:hypothetical protein [Lachnospiraceae bacterium]